MLVFDFEIGLCFCFSVAEVAGDEWLSLRADDFCLAFAWGGELMLGAAVVLILVSVGVLVVVL